MASNIENIASLQKVALVTGLNYQDSLEMSRQYPFALFFTNGHESDNDNPYTIIKAGKRYSRFIGIDDQKDTMQINNHTIKLSFDYDTGLISIADKYTLDSIEFINLSYTGVDGTEYEWDAPLRGIDINSRDNRFKVVAKFTPKDDDDVYYISKSLSFFFSKSDIIKFDYYNIDFDDPSIGTYYFYVVNNEENSLAINGYSNYANNIFNSFVISDIKLNPQYIDVYANGGHLYNNQIISIDRNSEKDIDIFLSCDTYRNSSFTDLVAKVVQIDNIDDNIIHFDNNILNEVPIENHIRFKMYSGDGYPNALSRSTFQIRIYNTVDEEYVYLRQEFEVILQGKTENTYWYLGTEQPWLFNDRDPIDRNKIKLLVGIPGQTLQYDASEYESYQLNNVKYFAIAKAYELSVFPRNNFYRIDGEGNKIYCDARNMMIRRPEEFTFNNVEFAVYEFTDDALYNGKFYGKIQ